MNNNQLIVIVIAILVAACIIGGAVAYTFNKPVKEVNVTMDNNTTNFTKNLTEDVSTSSDNEEKADGYYSEAEGKWVKYNYDPNKGQIITPESAKKWEEAAKNDEFNKR